MKTKYIGRCALHGRAEQILFQTGKEEWLAKMERGYSRVSKYPLTQEQRRAWSNSYDVLRDTFENLPPEYGKLELIFEYVLPQLNPAVETEKEDFGVRSDVLLLTQETVGVIEFKDRPGTYPGCERQARKYRNRLQRWHKESIGMGKKTILVFTLAEDLLQNVYRITACSPGRMAEAIEQTITRPFRPITQAGAKRWLASEWATRERYLRNKKKK